MHLVMATQQSCRGGLLVGRTLQGLGVKGRWSCTHLRQSPLCDRLKLKVSGLLGFWNKLPSQDGIEVV